MSDDIEKNVRVVQAAAESLRRDTGADMTIVLMMKGGALYSGAWVPSREFFRLMLQRAIDSLDEGSADIRDLNKS